MSHPSPWWKGGCVLGLILGLVWAAPLGAAGTGTAGPGTAAGTVDADAQAPDPLATDPLGADAQATDPRAALLGYVEANRPPEHKLGMVVREMGLGKYLQHPYAGKSLTRRLMAILQSPAGAVSDPATVLAEEIRDAKRVCLLARHNKADPM